MKTIYVNSTRLFVYCSMEYARTQDCCSNDLNDKYTDGQRGAD
jgi:hypothetical protein